MAEHEHFHLGRPDLETAGIDHALEAVGDKEVALFIHAPQITGAEKTLAIDLNKGSAGGSFVAPVA